MAASLQSGQNDAFVVELPVDISAVEDGRLALLGYLEQHDIGLKVINRIEVILEELVSNVARHGINGDVIRIVASIDGDAVYIAVEDNGTPFNPLEAEDPDAFTTLEAATLGGQGIPLVKRLSRSVAYERSGGFNRVSSVIARE